MRLNSPFSFSDAESASAHSRLPPLPHPPLFRSGHKVIHGSLHRVLAGHGRPQRCPCHTTCTCVFWLAELDWLGGSCRTYEVPLGVALSAPSVTPLSLALMESVFPLV